MTNYKSIKSNFWQSDFILGLSPGEKYFYLYLITNSMTNLCGIYKFNLKLAELETGYSAEKIQKYLNSLEELGKIRISKSSKEIMIVNWFKHNFKNSKYTKRAINKELREVKDKEFLHLLYVICQDKGYPVEDIFDGIKLSIIEGEHVKAIICEDKSKEKQIEKIVNQNIEETQQRTAESLEAPQFESIEEPVDDNEQPEGICIAAWSFGENRFPNIAESCSVSQELTTRIDPIKTAGNIKVDNIHKGKLYDIGVLPSVSNIKKVKELRRTIAGRLTDKELSKNKSNCSSSHKVTHIEDSRTVNQSVSRFNYYHASG